MKDFIGGSQFIVWINQDGSGPTPPVPGPLDFAFDDDGLTEESVTYALANPTATLGMAYSYTDDTHVPYATHGGEDLELVYVRKNAVQKKAAALFLGNGLTTEEAELVFGVDVGTFGPAVGRINDEYETPKKVVYSGGMIGEGTTTKLMQVTGFTGTGFMKAVYAGGGNGRVYGVTPIGNELLYVGAGLAGDKIVIDLAEMITSTPENFVRTETRAEHLDVSTQDSLNNDIPGVVGMAVGFKFNLEIETDQLFRYSARTSNSQFFRNLKGPYTGGIKDAILMNETALPIWIGFYGQYAWTIENVEIWPAAKHIHGAFGKNDAINNNDIVQFRVNPSSPYAVAAMVLQDDTEFGVLNRDGEPFNRDGEPMWDEQ